MKDVNEGGNAIKVEKILYEGSNSRQGANLYQRSVSLKDPR